MSSTTLRGRQPRPAWMERPRPLTRAAKALALVVVVTLVTVPFLVVVSTSLASTEQVIANGGWVLWPTDPTLDAYRDVLRGGVVTRALLVSVGVAGLGTLVSLTATVMLAYALSRPVVGRRPILLLILFTFLFPPGMIPLYLVVQSLGLLDTYPSLVLPVLVSVFNLVVMRGFFQGIPEELSEAARLDGAGDWAILRRVVLPLSKAVVAVVGLFYAVSYWNAFFTAILYLNDAAKWPLQAVLRLYVIQGASVANPSVTEAALSQSPQTIQMAVLVIAVVPILCVYPFLQRYFTKGVLTGAIKS